MGDRDRDLRHDKIGVGFEGPFLIEKTAIMGIDPGLTGAIVVFCLKENKILAEYDVPTLKKLNGRRECNYYDCARIIDVWAPKTNFAVIEDVHSMPQQGVVSMFNFGKIAGALEGMLASSLVKYRKVKPSVWKASLGLSHEKAESIALAEKIFKIKFRNDGRAEAALLAFFGKVNCRS